MVTVHATKLREWKLPPPTLLGNQNNVPIISVNNFQQRRKNGLTNN